ncbi:Borealin N terminal-domain-containing protein [Daldinia grandis]|nr:Borealin N terminal-domain-containing protein [Daldinia grandis]
MAPVKATRKRKSEAITGSINGQKIHTIRCSPERSPIKKRKLGLSLAQKQALVDNLQLEITERARRLRAQYNIQAQQLRSRVEMRVNRIPTALRKLKMGELLSKSLQPQQQQQPPRPPKSTYVVRPPPVPAKDGASAKPLPRKPVPAANAKGLSEEILSLDKENQGDDVQNLKKRPRGIPGKEPAAIQPGQVLSPTSSNTRIVPRARPAASPIKTLVSRPASPMKGPPPKPNIISSMADRVKASRPAITRKPTTSSMASSANGNASVRARQAAVPSRPPTAASTRGRRKASTASESSNGSSSTTVKKTTASRAAKTTAPAAKKTVMSTIKSATTKKPPATKAAASGTGTGRTLRKRA